MTDWLFSWKGLVLGGLVLLSAVFLGIFFRESTLGNTASIVGVAVSVLGFVVTIWTVLDARQQIEDAGDRAENAIAQMRAEARRVVGGIAAQLRGADCAALRRGVEDLRQAAQDAQWLRAVYRCQECRVIAYRLAKDHNLVDDEASALRDAADDLQLILRFIEKNRPPGHASPLQDRHMESLDGMIGLLARLQARFHHEPLRPT